MDRLRFCLNESAVKIRDFCCFSLHEIHCLITSLRPRVVSPGALLENVKAMIDRSENCSVSLRALSLYPVFGRRHRVYR